MLASSARMVPDIASAWFELPSALQTSSSPFFSMPTLGSAARAMVPSGPFTEIWPAAMLTSTPFGTGTGYLAMRDMGSPLRDDAEHFAADAVGARLAVGHHAARGRQDRHAQPVHHARDVIAPLVDAQTGLRDALDALDHRPSRVILEGNGELFLRVLAAFFAAFVADREVLDIALVLQHLGDRAFQLRRGHRDLGVADHLRITDAGQHVGDGV